MEKEEREKSEEQRMSVWGASPLRFHCVQHGQFSSAEKYLMTQQMS